MKIAQTSWSSLQRSSRFKTAEKFSAAKLFFPLEQTALASDLLELFPHTHTQM